MSKRLTAPFCLGVPGAYSVAMRQALAVRAAAPVFTALVGHEIAHLKHRDVTLSWLGRTAGYVLIPLLALPVLAGLAGGEPLLALDIAWRAAVLAAVVWIVPSELMRARELDADARAATRPGVWATLDRLLVKPAPTGLRSIRAWHPSHARRSAPKFVDMQSAVLWTSTLTTPVRRTAEAGAMIGRGSGEAYQL